MALSSFPYAMASILLSLFEHQTSAGSRLLGSYCLIASGSLRKAFSNACCTIRTRRQSEKVSLQRVNQVCILGTSDVLRWGHLFLWWPSFSMVMFIGWKWIEVMSSDVRVVQYLSQLVVWEQLFLGIWRQYRHLDRLSLQGCFHKTRGRGPSDEGES